MSKTFLFQAIQFIQTVLIQTIQFSISMQISSIQPIDRALSGATIPGQYGPGSNGNEGVLRIPQSSSIIEASPSDHLVSYPEHSLVGSYPSAKVQSVYSRNRAWLGKFLNEPEVILLHMVKWCLLFLSNMNNSIYY